MSCLSNTTPLVAVLLWRTQDRLCVLGHPSRVSDGERKLYEEIIMADTELRKIIDRMPIFFRQYNPHDENLPSHILQQKEVTQLSLSHKVSITTFQIFWHSGGFIPGPFQGYLHFCYSS